MAICFRHIVVYRIRLCLLFFLSQCTGDLRESAIECCYFVCHIFLTFRQKTAGYDIYSESLEYQSLLLSCSRSLLYLTGDKPIDNIFQTFVCIRVEIDLDTIRCQTDTVLRVGAVYLLFLYGSCCFFQLSPFRLRYLSLYTHWLFVAGRYACTVTL